MQISTWRTDAGDLDVLNDIPDGAGRRMRYDELIGRASVQDVHGRTVLIAALDDVIASKEWADQPKDRPGAARTPGHEAARELIRRSPEAAARPREAAKRRFRAVTRDERRDRETAGDRTYSALTATCGQPGRLSPAYSPTRRHPL
jgi:hypothetical protein